MRQRPFRVEHLRRHFSRDDQLALAVVQHVHQPSEAPGLGGQTHGHFRHARQDHRVETAGDLQVVVLRPRPTAQGVEIEPDHAARLAHQGNATVIGVNLGRVGFLLPVVPLDLTATIRAAVNGSIPIEERVVLEVETTKGDVHFAVNEVVLERAQPGHMVRVRTQIDGDDLLTYSADGVMVATPTGSTGYNFSAGGPVLATSLASFVVTPVAPHFTIDRSVVVGASSEIHLHAVDRPALVVADGELRATIEPGESIVIRRSARSVRVGTPVDGGFGARLRHSLREGHAQ